MKSTARAAAPVVLSTTPAFRWTEIDDRGVVGDAAGGPGGRPGAGRAGARPWNVSGRGRAGSRWFVGADVRRRRRMRAGTYGSIPAATRSGTRGRSHGRRTRACSPSAARHHADAGRTYRLAEGDHRGSAVPVPEAQLDRAAGDRERPGMLVCRHRDSPAPSRRSYCPFVRLALGRALPARERRRAAPCRASSGPEPVRLLPDRRLERHGGRRRGSKCRLTEHRYRRACKVAGSKPAAPIVSGASPRPSGFELSRRLCLGRIFLVVPGVGCAS